MTCTVPESASPDDAEGARKEPRLWLFVSLAWGAIVALVAGLLDRSWLAAAHRGDRKRYQDYGSSREVREEHRNGSLANSP